MGEFSGKIVHGGMSGMIVHGEIVLLPKQLFKNNNNKRQNYKFEK